MIRPLVNLIAFVAMLVMNYLSNALRFNGNTIGGVSDQFEVYFVPAGYAFSIWGLIYLGLAGYCVFRLLPTERQNERLKATDGLFVLTCAANVGWLFVWLYRQFVGSEVLMLVLLAALIAIYLRLGIGRTHVSRRETILVRIPFGMYLGWISVATIANTTMLLAHLGWDGFGIDGRTWAIIMLAVGCALAAAVALTRRDVVYVLVLVWAYVAIAVKQADVGSVATAAWIGTGLLAVIALIAAVAIFRRKKHSAE